MSGLNPPPPIAGRSPAPEPPRRRRRRLPWRNIAGVAILLFLLVEVVFVLPRLMERRRLAQQQASPQAATPSPAVPEQPPPPDPFVQQAADTRERVDELIAALEARGAPHWATEAWSRAQAAIAEGDRAREAGSHAGATGAYKLAVGTLEGIQSRAPELLNLALTDGRRALERGDSRGATAAFERAQEIAPESSAARSGLQRAAVLDELVDLLHRGADAEASRDLETARQHYAAAVALDPQSAAAHQSLGRVTEGIQTSRFSAAMSSALNALDAGDHDGAAQALEQAESLRPGSAAVRDARERIRHEQALERISFHGERARGLEELERWQEAVAEYDQVLAVDSNIRFARDGRDRAAARADLHRRLEYHVAHGERLSTDSVYAEVEQLLAEASEVSANSAGPILQGQVRTLGELLDRYAVRIRVVLESDEQTEVLVYQIGRLGRFERHELELRPGTYTVVGSRPGYRDVRRQLVVAADGTPPAPLRVRCTEKI